MKKKKIQHPCTSYKGYLTVSQCMKAIVCDVFVWVPGCMVWCHGTCVEVRGPQKSHFPCVTQRRSRHQTSCLQASWDSCLQLLLHHSHNEIAEASYSARLHRASKDLHSGPHTSMACALLDKPQQKSLYLFIGWIFVSL